jgi:hypothetical protein
MKTKQSVVGIIEAIHSVMLFSPVKIYYNRKCIWDDTLAIDNGWVPIKDAMDRFRDSHKDWEQIVVTNVKVKVVEWHHGVVYLRGKVKKTKENQQ